MTTTPDTFATAPMWAGFIAFVIAMLALDLFVFGGKKAHRVAVKEALAWVIAWVTPALAASMACRTGADVSARRGFAVNFKA